jgi:IS5 family transposase
MIRRVRRTVPAVAGVEVAAHDYDSAGKPICAWDDPQARDELITGLVNDALAVLDAVGGVELDDEQQQLVALLALVAGQDVEPDPEGGEGAWRIARGVASERVISTVDPESRHMHKSRSSYRDGYKAHLAVEPETGLITGCELTPANEGDGPIGARLVAREDAGFDVLADSAYGSGPVRADLAEAGHSVIIKPWPLARNPKLGDDQFDRDDFAIDYEARTVTCPEGQTVRITARGNATFGVRCHTCPSRQRCTSAANGRGFTVTGHDELLATARADWRAGTHIDDYRQHRPMVERTIAWLVANGHRRVRFRGVERNRLGLSLRAAAINLRRLINLGLHHAPTGWALI